MKKSATDVLLRTDLRVKLNVTILATKVRNYEMTDPKGNKIGYDRLFTVFTVTDDEDFLPMQKTLSLSASKDPAYGMLLNVKPGTSGILTIMASEIIMKERVQGDGSRGSGGTECELIVESFVPEKE